jgi:hypothetical protein
MSSDSSDTTSSPTSSPTSSSTSFYKYKLLTALSIASVCAAAFIRCGTPQCLSLYEAHIRATLSGVFDVGRLAIMVSATTLFAGTMLCIPLSRQRAAMRSEFKQCISDQAAADAAFKSACIAEYDLMMASASATAANTDAQLTPIAVDTPRGKLVMSYVPGKTAFGYYSDRKDSLAYTHLETAARMFLVKNKRPDLAALAYADRRVKSISVDPATAPAPAPPTPAPPPPPIESSSGVFALFRNYNRKPAAPVVSTECAVTHFVYLGTMHDYDEACAPKSPSASEYANIDYAEFKKKTKSD